MAEAIVTLAVLGVLLGGYAIAQERFRRFNSILLARHRCIAAARAQLDSIAATGRPMPPEQVGRCWPEVKTKIETRQGEGQWQGLLLVKAAAATTVFDREVNVSLSRYVSPKESQ